MNDIITGFIILLTIFLVTVIVPYVIGFIVLLVSDIIDKPITHNEKYLTHHNVIQLDFTKIQDCLRVGYCILLALVVLIFICWIIGGLANGK